ncbi:hypothetical protein IC582_006789 [Cucumis melo]
MNGGFVGVGSFSSFFISICSTFDIVGRRDALSCVQRSPICTTLNISSFVLLSSSTISHSLQQNHTKTVHICLFC